MNLDDIQNGSLCVIDTSILLCAEQGVSAQAQRLLWRCSTGELIGVLPQTVWQELSHKLMLAEAMMLGRISGPNPSMHLTKKPEVIQSLSIYREKVAALQALGLGFEACNKEDVIGGLEIQNKYGLLIKDAILLNIALRIEADVIVSRNERFRTLDHLEIASPSDIT
ncbi:MAG: type II toxin-antitoxin system VapC family toxin [Deltaproteobacteria bacterium]|nr:type II toxin-antitoxin system VapC family toxin [Deltaproteobacteria bacterium]MBW2117195.1 type II toxin-antitoxin system VapC family toxin [Deltaproteobacteria bacterium]